MRRRDRALGIAFTLALAGAAPVHAGVENSPHDLIAHDYDVPKTGGSQERCLLCHAAAGVSSPEPSQVPASLRGRYGTASLLCFSCHDGITLVTPEADASLTAFHPGGHGHDLAHYRSLREQGVELPHVAGDHLECTACHDPHNNSRRPFLRAPLNELCLQCHSALAGALTEGVNNTGNHPLGIDPAEVALPEVPLLQPSAFAVAFPFPYPLLGGKGSAGTHWDLGGHLLQGASGEVACITCHAVHGDEGAPPAPKLLTVDPVNDVADEFCESCHRGRRGDDVASGAAPNPGGTSAGRTYHPCDDDDANGKGRLLPVTVPEDWPLGGGFPRRLLCTTCHRAHGAEVGTALVRPPIKAAGFCEECHTELRLEHHHPTSAMTGPCAERIAPLGVGGVSLGCASCHRAHNAGLGAVREQDFVPLLRSSSLSDDLCSGCHPADNPTCGEETTHRSSHFLGDPGLSDTYDDRDPPLRTELWPESQLLSRYGGPAGKSVLCFSCHSFSKGALVTGDDGDTGHLLARSGNPTDWEKGEESKYLCTGCHGLRPGTGSATKGHTHPLMDADTLALGLPVRPPASATTGGRMNCDSCHRPHAAATAGGVYILEAAEGTNTDPMAIQPKVDYTPTCHFCHDAGKY